MSAPPPPFSADTADTRTALQKALYGVLRRAMHWREQAPARQQFLAGLGMIALGTGLRELLHALDAEVTYLPLLPTVTLAAAFLRAEIGLTVIVLTALQIHFLFVPKAGPGHDIAQLIYLAAAGFTVLLADLFVRAQKVALLESRRADRVERLNAAVIEYSNDAILTHTLDGLVTTWNPAATAMLGYPAEERIGRPVHDLCGTEVDQSAEIFARVRAGKTVEHFETRLRSRDGRRIDRALGVRVRFLCAAAHKVHVNPHFFVHAIVRNDRPDDAHGSDAARVRQVNLIRDTRPRVRRAWPVP